MRNGKFIISLDLELFWGVFDKRTITSYGENIKNEHQVIPKMLDLFSKYNIHATWATVGFLFCKNKDEILRVMPKKKPSYDNVKLNPYNILDSIGVDGSSDPYHYADELIKLIQNTPNQELATHTFSHYYCLEPGQNVDEFADDLDAAILIADKSGIKIDSIVFPRNQYHDKYLQVCFDKNIHIYRGNELHWAYNSHSGEENTYYKRLYRLIDTYLNLSGYHTYIPNYDQRMINLPASRFLRPYSNKFKYLEALKLRRIYKSMEYAAKESQVYHLWWHPHNFGSNTEQNLIQLEWILQRYTELKEKYGMLSFNMRECGAKP